MRTVILDYINHGFSPIPVPYKTKAPITKEWNKLAVTANNFESYFDGTETNIGILTGKPSGGLVDVDIDSLDALKFASWFLPKTNCIFGHESKPKSHWVYRVPAAKAVEQFIANRRMIVEIRGHNRCTVFPGSVHPSGEKIEFENPDNYEPSTSTWKQLKRAGSKIAIATELGKVWSPGTRHELTLCTAAKLARIGWSIAEVRDLITAVASEANDEEIQDRSAAVESTFAAYDQGRQISGEERFLQLVGKEVAEDIHKWACSPDNLKQLMKPKKLLSPSESEKPIPTILSDLSNDFGRSRSSVAPLQPDLHVWCEFIDGNKEIDKQSVPNARFKIGGEPRLVMTMTVSFCAQRDSGTPEWMPRRSKTLCMQKLYLLSEKLETGKRFCARTKLNHATSYIFLDIVYLWFYCLIISYRQLLLDCF